MKPTIKPTPKQWQAWQKLQDTETHYILYGGAAGGGKTWLGCEWLLTSCFHYPGTKWFVGRRELKKIRESVLPTIYKVCRYHKIPPDSMFRFNGQDNYLKFHNDSVISFLELKYLPQDPLYERFGSLEFTGGWLEEAGEIDFMAFDVLKSRVGRWENDFYKLTKKVLITANPKKNWLYGGFYKPWRTGELSENKAFIPAFVDDNTYGESQYKQNLMELREKALRERLLNGNWEYDDDPSALMDYDSILALFDDSSDKLLDPDDTRYITADVARFGADRTVVMVWHGWKVISIKTIDRGRLTGVISLIESLKSDHGVRTDNIIVDEDGLGGGVVDALGCRGFVNNSQAIKVSGKQENFANLKSQGYYKMAEYVNRRKMTVVTSNEKIKTALTEELEVVKIKDLDKDGKIAVLPKDKVKELIGRSPDYSDALMMRMLPALSVSEDWSMINGKLITRDGPSIIYY